MILMKKGVEEPQPMAYKVQREIELNNWSRDYKINGIQLRGDKEGKQLEQNIFTLLIIYVSYIEGSLQILTARYLSKGLVECPSATRRSCCSLLRTMYFI